MLGKALYRAVRGKKFKKNKTFLDKLTNFTTVGGKNSVSRMIWNEPVGRTAVIAVASYFTGGLAAGWMGAAAGTAASAGIGAGAGALAGGAVGYAGDMATGNPANTGSFLSGATTGALSGAAGGYAGAGNVGVNAKAASPGGTDAAAQTVAPKEGGGLASWEGEIATQGAPGAPGGQGGLGPANADSGLQLGTPGGQGAPGSGPAAASAGAEGGGLLQSAMEGLAEDPYQALQIVGSGLSGAGDSELEQEALQQQEDQANAAMLQRYIQMFLNQGDQGRTLQQQLGLLSFRNNQRPPVTGGLRFRGRG